MGEVESIDRERVFEGSDIELIVDGARKECTREYCFLKELLIRNHPEVIPAELDCLGNPENCKLKASALALLKNRRVLVQAKCLEKFKYEESTRERQDITWKGATEEWIYRGYAKTFASIYSPAKSVEQIYRETINNNFVTEWH